MRFASKKTNGKSRWAGLGHTQHTVHSTYRMPTSGNPLSVFASLNPGYLGYDRSPLYSILLYSTLLCMPYLGIFKKLSYLRQAAFFFEFRIGTSTMVQLFVSGLLVRIKVIPLQQQSSSVCCNGLAWNSWACGGMQGQTQVTEGGTCVNHVLHGRRKG